MNEIIQSLEANATNGKENFCYISEEILLAMKELSKREEQDNNRLKEQVNNLNETLEKMIKTNGELGIKLHDRAKQLQQRDSIIEETIKHVKSLSSKGRDCMIYADVKKDILDILNKYKGDNND